MMLRHDVLQGLLDSFEAPSYLEVGVDEGVTFHHLRAARKTAVDPAFKFDLNRARLSNPTARYFPVYSDEFFRAALRQKERFDVIFLDGLHTFDQILKDLLNAIFVLNADGLIVIDDVLPSDYAAAAADIPTMFAIRQATGSHEASWMGDVFKILFFLAENLLSFDYASLRENHGQTILWRSRTSIRSVNDVGGIRAISNKDYKDSLLCQEVYRFKSYNDIICEIKSQRNFAGALDAEAGA